MLEINEENSFSLLFISSQVELVNVTMICESVKSYKKASCVDLMLFLKDGERDENGKFIIAL